MSRRSQIPTPVVGSDRPSSRGLTKEDLPSVFQPIVSLSDGSTFAYEALVRCTYRAFPSPVGLLNQAVLEGTVGQLGRMIRQGIFERCPQAPIFVNLHPHELSAPWLVRPDDPICFHEHPVYLEVTESATLDYYDLCRSVLKEVCVRNGAYLVVDDLGAGYSNLMRVVELEPAMVKLDRALVTELDQSPRKRVLVSNIVSMCQQLGARVVGEGIETVDELEALRDCGADFGQGYLLARPGFPPPAVRWPLAEPR